MGVEFRTEGQGMTDVGRIQAALDALRESAEREELAALVPGAVTPGCSGTAAGAAAPHGLGDPVARDAALAGIDRGTRRTCEVGADWRSQPIAPHELVHCAGVLEHDPDPAGLVRHLRSMLADGGDLLLACTQLADPELSEHARLVPVPAGADGGPGVRWIPGRLALRWLLGAAGLEVVDEPRVEAGPPGEPCATLVTLVRARILPG